MESIRVELTRDIANDRWNLLATIGSVDVSEQVLNQPMAAFRGYLPSELRNYGRPSQQRAYDLRGYLTHGRRGFSMTSNPLPPQALTDAIRAYLTEIAPSLEGESAVSAIESEMDIAENLAASQPPMLSMGGRLFRLSPVAESAAPLKLLERMRRQAAAAIATQRTALLASATREAAIIREQAAQDRVALERERLEWQCGRGREAHIPLWVGHSPIKRAGDRDVATQIKLLYQPTKFVYPGWIIAEGARRRTVNLEWDAIALPPVMTFIWLKFNPINGSYLLENARIDLHWPELPHANQRGFCCQPQGLPEWLNSETSLTRIVVAIQRAFKEVNLSSLLTSVERWSPQVKAFMPTQCLEFWNRYQDEGSERTNPTDFGARIVERERPEEVWAAPGHSADNE